VIVTIDVACAPTSTVTLAGLAVTEKLETLIVTVVAWVIVVVTFVYVPVMVTVYVPDGVEAVVRAVSVEETVAPNDRVTFT
jgi:Na+-transporting NADH:ubiquinone oxidoreductase subunit NqrD